MDLTIVATPAFFASMGVEHWWLRRRARRRGPSPVDYAAADTRASLTMGALSLLVPRATGAVLSRVAPQRGRAGRLLVATAAAGAVVTAGADRVARAGASPRARRAAEATARVTGPLAVTASTVTATAAWVRATAPSRLWPRRLVGDLGSGWAATAAAVAGWDLLYYWNHRLMHECRLLWAYHVVHHSSERYNLSTALRQPVTDPFGTALPYWLLCLVGIRPSVVMTARGINLLYQYWIHTDTIGRLGPVESVLNTPSHHRVHHGSNPRYIDRNHGSIVITWDRLFGTFEREDEPVVYGLTRNVDSFDPWRIATHEYADILRDVRDATSWRDRVSYVVRGPGWAYRRRAALAC